MQDMNVENIVPLTAVVASILVALKASYNAFTLKKKKSQFDLPLVATKFAAPSFAPQAARPITYGYERAHLHQQQARRANWRLAEAAASEGVDTAAAGAAAGTGAVKEADEAIEQLMNECVKPTRDVAAINRLCQKAASASEAAGYDAAAATTKTEGAWQLLYASTAGAADAIGTPPSSRPFGSRVEGVFVSFLGGIETAQQITAQDSQFWDDAKIIDEVRMSEEERIKKREEEGFIPQKGVKVALVGLKNAPDFNGRQGILVDDKPDASGKVTVELEEDLFFPEMTATIFPKNLEEVKQPQGTDFFEATTGAQAEGVAWSTARVARAAKEGQVLLETAEILRRIGPFPNICNTLSGVAEPVNGSLEMSYQSMQGEFQQEIEIKGSAEVSGKVAYANNDAFILMLDPKKVKGDDPNPILIFRREENLASKFKELGVNLDGRFPFLL